MISRVILGYVLGVVAFIPVLANSTRSTLPYKLAVVMTTDAAGPLQVFFDIGNGFSEADSVTSPLLAGRGEYTLPLGPGRYKGLRIDPGTGPGRYAIERINILEPGGSLYRVIQPAELNPAYQLSVIERTADRLVVDCPPDSHDPQLLYFPSEPFWLTLTRQSADSLFAKLFLYCLGGIFLVILSEFALRPAAPTVARGLTAAAARATGRPKAAVVAIALLVTLVATYPVVFLHRSFVSPNNGGTVMLYDRPPFVHGSRDLQIEDTRQSDVGATMWQEVPYSRVQREALSQGELPLWNRFNASGRPLWGQSVSFPLDPLHWLTLITPDLSIGWDLKFLAHRFVFSAGVGLAALIATGGWVPAAVAASIAPFLGYFAFRFNHPAAFSLSYAPWILAAWFLLARAETRSRMARAALLLVISSALTLLASPPKEAFVMLLGCQAAGLLALVFERGRNHQFRNHLQFAGMAGAATVAITTPHWLVFLETLRQSVTVYDQPGVDFVPLSAIPTLFLGPLRPGMALPSMHIAAMLLLVAGLWRVSRRPSVLACFVAAMCLLMIAFGAIPASWLIRIPLVSVIHQINVTAVASAFVLLLMVCASGAEALLTARRLEVGIVTVFIAFAAMWLLRDVDNAGGPDRFEFWLTALLLAGATAVPLSVQALQRTPDRVLPIVCTLGLGAFLLLPGGLHIESGVAGLDRVLQQPRPRVELDESSPGLDALHRAITEPSRVVGLGLLLMPGTQSLYDLEGFGGADPLEVRWFAELVDAAGVRRQWFWLFQISEQELGRLTAFLDMLDVGYLVSSSETIPPGMTRLSFQGSDLLRVIRRPGAWPRAFFVDGVATYGDAPELLAKAAQAGGPFAAIQADDRRASNITLGMTAPATTVVRATNYRLTANTTTFVVQTPGPGVAVLTETFLPDDFRATLNGVPVPYFRVNHAFKAVSIPSSGVWSVKFEYRPAHWNLSLAIAGLGIVLLAGLAVAARDKKRVQAGTPGSPPASRR